VRQPKVRGSCRDRVATDRRYQTGTVRQPAGFFLIVGGQVSNRVERMRIDHCTLT